jgi:hypothetical protein
MQIFIYRDYLSREDAINAALPHRFGAMRDLSAGGARPISQYFSMK